MKELYYRFQEWRYRRLFHKLFWFYAKKTDANAVTGSADYAIANAVTAFEWLADFEYKDLYRRFRKSDVPKA